MSIEHIQLLRGTAENLESANPVPLAGEIVIETDTGKFKIGNGVTTWTELDYVSDNCVSSNSLGHETWTMTLEDDSVITKDVATRTSQG